jgi:hypothetical protein
MSQREDTISLILVRTPGTPEQLTQLRRELLAKTTVELNKIADQQTLDHYRAQAVRTAVEQHPQVIAAEQQARAAAEKLLWAQIFRTVINGRVAVDNEANRSIISSWINFDEQISPEWFKQVFAENPNMAQSLLWQSAKVLDPKFQKYAADAQALQDRETFSKFARANDLSEVEANFHLVKSVLGSGFDQYALAQAVNSGQVQLAPASPEELAKFHQEAAVARADFLRNYATPDELREAAATEAEQRRQAAQQQFVNEQDEAGRKRAAESGKPQLPEVNSLTGEKLDATFFNKLSVTNRQEFRRYVGFYGGNQIVDRMRGIR